jgi:signal transduction histidine kinase
MKKRNLHGMLMKNYVVFVVIMLGAALLSLAFMGMTLEKVMADEQFPLLTADSIVKSDYESIDTTDVSLMGGWVEILDGENRVIFVKGEKKTDEDSYTSSRLYEMLSYRDNDSNEWFCTASIFKAVDGNEYTCLVFLPGKNVRIEMNLINAPLPVTKRFLTVFLISVLLFLMIFSLNIFLYSKWTAAKISKPLCNITSSLHELRSGRLDIRMDFQAENEFLQIRDAFNDMADRLESAQREKADMEQARNRMFIDISHDLKTPMTVIGGYSKALAENMVMDEDKRKRYIETIYSKSQYVSGMIEDLFELARFDMNKKEIDAEDADIAEFLRNIAAEHYDQIEDKGLLLDLDIPEKTVMYRFDKKEMSRAVSNILTNAVRYNQAGTTIHIGLTDISGQITITIADNGTGIPESLRTAIFDPFVRGDASRSGSGTGLGLAIAKRIVERHGGTLKLDDDPNRAYRTSFVMTFGRGADQDPQRQIF